mmetsp:Transcript_13194/g.55227  ORF Transcript_13194/g.55227 Transcript_13194/m.55227 type:complete len:229 (+) Transcript_13194:154-840(+)
MKSTCGVLRTARGRSSPPSVYEVLPRSVIVCRSNTCFTQGCVHMDRSCAQDALRPSSSRVRRDERQRMPHALQSVLGPAGPARHCGVFCTPQHEHARPSSTVSGVAPPPPSAGPAAFLAAPASLASEPPMLTPGGCASSNEAAASALGLPSKGALGCACGFGFVSLWSCLASAGCACVAGVSTTSRGGSGGCRSNMIAFLTSSGSLGLVFLSALGLLADFGDGLGCLA